MKVLITGGAGYLGSVLCEHLLQAGYQIVVVDNLMYGQHSLFHLAHCADFQFVKGDARDEGLMRSLVKEADVRIPLAAVVGAPACDRDPWLAESVDRTPLAIGCGINESNYPMLKDMGFALIISERGITEAPDPAKAARRLVELASNSAGS